MKRSQQIIVIDKTGTVKSTTTKDAISVDTLYKKAGLKSGEGFGLQHTWGEDDGLDFAISLYGKKTGRAGQENKYDFPPPVDQTLFFGSCVLVARDLKTGEVAPLSEEGWEEIYEFLFGGFEDLGSEDSDEEDVDTEDELENIRKSAGKVVAQTKQGYAKDGFIVDDDDEEDEDYEDEEDVKPVTKPKRGRKPAVVESVPPKSASKKKKSVEPIPPQPEETTELVLEDCENELSEEEYD